MIDDLFAWLLAVAFAVRAIVVHSQRAQCPPNQYVEGVRRNGSTWCAIQPKSDPDCTGSRPCHGEQPIYTVPLQIYCTGGSQPIVINERTIGCQRRP